MIPTIHTENCDCDSCAGTMQFSPVPCSSCKFGTAPAADMVCEDCWFAKNNSILSVEDEGTDTLVLDKADLESLSIFYSAYTDRT